MPIQIEENKFIQFVYNPIYLREDKKSRKTISDADAICKAIKLEKEKSTILIDGGNVIKANDKIIMTDRVFEENPNLKKEDLTHQLQKYFQIDKILFLPADPDDFTGHADGMIRFYDVDTVLINNYVGEKVSKKEIEFNKKFHSALKTTGLKIIEIPCNYQNNNYNHQANGAYINYLQMNDCVFLPIFNFKEDDIVVRQFEELFKGQRIETINCNEIANEGGVLNCISWNILK
jgi:agmatine deiminase